MTAIVLYDDGPVPAYKPMMGRMVRGFSKPLESFSYMSEKNLWGYAVFPLIMTAATVFLMGLGIVLWLFSLDGKAPNIDLSQWPAFVQWLLYLLGFVLKIVVLLLLFSLLMRVFLLLFSVLVIPFMSPLVEKILIAEGITTIKISGTEMVGFILSAIVYNLKLLFWQALVAIGLMLTGPLQPVLNFFFSGYFVGRSYFDYVFELLGRPREFSQMARGNRAEATGIGVFSNVFVFVPIVGVILAPLLCVVAATRIYAEKQDTNRQ